MPLRQFLLCTVISFALSLQAQTHQQTVPEIVKGASDAVVLIVVADSSGKETALGSGFIVSADGRIVTNLHVIRGSNSAIAKMANGAFFLVDGLLGVDDKNDLAILKVNGKNLPHLSLSAAPPEIGEHVVAIGSPLGLQNTVSDGIVSGMLNVSPSRSMIQTTAPISQGNSGGPLLNSEGQVIGVITAYLSEGQNLNLATPSPQVEELLGRSGALVPLDAVRNPKVVQDQKNVVTQPQPPAQPQKRRQEILSQAKSIYIAGRCSPVTEAEINKKINAWGHLDLVTQPSAADLVLEVIQTGELNLGTGAGNQATAVLKDYRSGLQLWSTARGGSLAMSGWSNAWVGRAIAKDLIKFLSSAVQRNSKSK